MSEPGGKEAVPHSCFAVLLFLFLAVSAFAGDRPVRQGSAQADSGLSKHNSLLLAKGGGKGRYVPSPDSEPPQEKSGAQVVIEHIPEVGGKVLSVTEHEITIDLELLEFKNQADSPVVKLAEGIIQKSLFIAGLPAKINGVPVTVKESSSAALKAAFDGHPVWTAGDKVKVSIPQKNLAIADFAVSGGKEKNAGKVTMEGLESALIGSGYFVVIERSRLKTVMDELQLARSGLAKEKSGIQLLEADLILTGSLTDRGDTWDINLDLADAKTGHSLAAIALKAPFAELYGVKNVSAMEEDFEKDIVSAPPMVYEGKRPLNTYYNSWVLGYRKKGHAYISIDDKNGAGGSKHSLRMDFDLAALSDDFFFMENGDKRNISFFDGLEFYAKTSEPLTGQLRILIADRDDSLKVDAWVAKFEVGPDWKLVRLPFDQLVVARGWIKKGAAKRGVDAGAQVIDLSRVTEIDIGVHSSQNPPVKGSMWIDRIRFYRE